MLSSDLTSDGLGTSGKRLAATRKISGAGFPSLISLSLEPITLWWNKLNKSLWFLDFIFVDSIEPEVAKQIGILFFARCLRRRSTPFEKEKKKS